MAARLTDNGERYILDRATSPGAWAIGLIANDFTYSEGLVDADIDEPNSGVYTFYGDLALNDWGPAGTTAGVTTTTCNTVYSTVHDGVADPLEIFGYYLHDQTTYAPKLVEKFAESIVLSNVGDRIDIQVVLSLRDEDDV